MPNQGGQNSEAEHQPSGANSDDAHFQTSDIAGLLRIVGVQETPHEGRHEDRDRRRPGYALEQRHGEQTKPELLGRGGHQRHRQRIQPGGKGGKQIGLLNVLRAPHAVLLAHQIESRDEGQVKGREPDPGYGGAEELARLQRPPREGRRQVEFAG